jgi:hypothetical protein
VIAQAMGPERAAAARQKRDNEAAAYFELSQAEQDALAEADFGQHEVAGTLVSKDPEIGLLELLESRLNDLESQELDGDVYQDEVGPYLMSVSEAFISPEGRQSMHYIVYRVIDGRIIAEHHNYIVGSMASARRVQIKQERALGLNAQPVEPAIAIRLSERIEDYHTHLVRLAQLPPPELLRSLRIGEV